MRLRHLDTLTQDKTQKMSSFYYPYFPKFASLRSFTCKCLQANDYNGNTLKLFLFIIDPP